jgi:hypothetical protein
MGSRKEIKKPGLVTEGATHNIATTIRANAEKKQENTMVNQRRAVTSSLAFPYPN